MTISSSVTVGPTASGCTTICDLPLPVARPVFEPTPQAHARIANLLRERGPEVARWVCFNTGAGGRWREKRWKARYYAELAG